MTIKMHIHSSYSHMSNAIKGIMHDEYQYDKIYCNKRNLVAKLTIEGREFVVKKFKKPHLLNRIVYTFLRKTKPQRAYENALKLMESGIKTPFPVAYMELKSGGLFHTGFLLTEYVSHPLIETLLLKDIESYSSELEQLEEDLIRFTIKMNEKGVLPKDYNGGNIFYLYDAETGHYDFALTDVNRVFFNVKPSQTAVIRHFEQMGVQLKNLYRFMTKLASLQGSNTRECMYEFLRIRTKKRHRKMFFSRIKSLFKGKNR